MISSQCWLISGVVWKFFFGGGGGGQKAKACILKSGGGGTGGAWFPRLELEAICYLLEQ